MPAVNCRLFIFTILLSARSAQALEIESGLWRYLDSGTTRCMNSQTIADEVRHFADDIRFWNNGEVPQHEFTYHIGDRHAPNTATVRYAQPNRDGSPHTVELKISRLDRKPLAYIITVNGETKISHWQYTGKPCPPAR